MTLLAQSQSLETGWRQVSAVTLQPDLHHVQGIDVEGGVLWVSSVDARAKKGYLSRLDAASGRLLSQVEVQEGARFHPGGLMLDGAAIWVPVAEYHKGGPSTIQKRDKNTLALLTSFEVADHIGCIAASATSLIGGSWSSRTVYAWSKDGTLLWKRENPIPTAWQDLKMDGDLLMGSGGLSRTEGAIDWVRLPSLELVQRITTGRTDRGVPFTHEGMAWRQGQLYFLPEDAPSRLFVLERKP